MARARTPRALTLGLDAITVEGSLIAPAMLAQIAAQPDDDATRTAYRIPKGLAPSATRSPGPFASARRCSPI